MRLRRFHLPFLNSPEEARAMYEGGRANAVARRYARFWVAVLGRGLLPGRGAVLEVPGRNSGQPRRFPLVEARIDRDRYLVSMLGEECNWVRNVRAVDGVVKLRHGRVESVQLVEVPVEQRARVIKRYVEQAPGARPHIPVDRSADVSVFETIAARYPVFRITTGQQQI
jgi:deazaflavin-dependent oxidoreductase (nitroreductase family)